MDEVNIVVVVPEANEMVCSGGRYYVEVTPLRLLPIIYAYCKMHTHNTPGSRLLFFFEGRPQRLLRGAVLLPQDYTNEQSAKSGYTRLSGIKAQVAYFILTASSYPSGVKKPTGF